MPDGPQRKRHFSSRYYDRLENGITSDLEVGDRIVLQHGEHPGVVLEVRENDTTNYKLRKEYRVQLFETGEIRWINRDQAAFMPAIRNLYKRAERVRQLWNERNYQDGAKWAQSKPVEVRTYSLSEGCVLVEL